MSSTLTRRGCARALCAILCALLVLPATGWAASGGGAGLTGSGNASSTAAPSQTVRTSNVNVSTSGDGITLQTRASAILRQGLQFTGSVPAGLSGATVEIERLGHETNWRWAPTVAATVAPGGTFSAVWSTNHIGRFSIRAVVARPGEAQAASATSALTVTVYRPSLATEYGPGFYGHRTACGQRLGRNTVGVANRTLHCGESVAIMYGGRTLVVPVIDRGPYANHADWDLTMATGRVLGIKGTAMINAVSLPIR